MMKLQLLLLAAVCVTVLVAGISAASVGKQVVTEAVASGDAMFAMMDSEGDTTTVLEAVTEEVDVTENKTPFNGTNSVKRPYYYIESLQTGKTMEIENAQSASSAHVVMYDFHGGNNQLWAFENGVFYSKYNNLVMEISDETGNIITAVADGGSNQKWHFNADNTIGTAKNDRDVMDVYKRQIGNGAWVISYPHNGDKNQQFRMVYYVDA